MPKIPACVVDNVGAESTAIVEHAAEASAATLAPTSIPGAAVAWHPRARALSLPPQAWALLNDLSVVNAPQEGYVSKELAPHHLHQAHRHCDHHQQQLQPQTQLQLQKVAHRDLGAQAMQEHRDPQRDAAGGLDVTIEDIDPADISSPDYVDESLCGDKIVVYTAHSCSAPQSADLSSGGAVCEDTSPYLTSVSARRQQLASSQGTEDGEFHNIHVFLQLAPLCRQPVTFLRTFVRGLGACRRRQIPPFFGRDTAFKPSS